MQWSATAFMPAGSMLAHMQKASWFLSFSLIAHARQPTCESSLLRLRCCLGEPSRAASRPSGASSGAVLPACPSLTLLWRSARFFSACAFSMANSTTGRRSVPATTIHMSQLHVACSVWKRVRDMELVKCLQDPMKQMPPFTCTVLTWRFKLGKSVNITLRQNMALSLRLMP